MLTSEINHLRAIEKWQRENKHCPSCDARIPYEKRGNRFCSHSCAASYNNLGVRRHGKPKEARGACVFCGNSLRKGQTKYCSSPCMKEYRHKKYIRHWLAGDIDGIVSNGISTHIRRYLFEERGQACEICGWSQASQFTGNIPVEIHHKDGNWMNNRLTNLQIICPNCHSLTGTYKNLNKSTRKR